MTWQNFSYLWFLFIIPILVTGLWWYGKQRIKQREQFFNADLFESLRRGFWSLGDRIKMISLYAGLAFLIVAAAGPKIGTAVKQVKRQGVDLIIALDLSASMNAEDVKPSRLEKAKYEISRLIDRLKGDRVGLIVFTGDAYLQSPMTLDYSALRLFLNIAETNQMPNSATDFNAAMETADKAFDSINENKKGKKPAKVLFIISDGENHNSSYSEGLNKLTKDKVSIYTLGIGTQAGSTIPLYNDKTGGLIGYKRDNDGKVITTRLEPKVLQNIAQQGNGQFYSIRGGSEGIDAFLARLDELQQGEFASQQYADFKNQYQWLAGIGLAFLLMSIFFPNYKTSKE